MGSRRRRGTSESSVEQLASIWEHCSSALGNTGGYGDGRPSLAWLRWRTISTSVPSGRGCYRMASPSSRSPSSGAATTTAPRCSSAWPRTSRGHSVTSGKFKGRVWGLAPWNGRLLGFPDPCKRAADRKGEIRGEPLLIGNSDFRGRATGSVVRVRVDMEEKRLYLKCAYGAKQLAEAEWSLARDGDQAHRAADERRPPVCARRQEGRHDLHQRHGLRAARRPERVARAADAAAKGRPRPHAAKRGQGVGERLVGGAVAADEQGDAVVGERRRPSLAEAREQELLAVIEKLRTEVDSLKLSLGRERLLRQQAEHEAGRVNRGLDAIVPNRRGNVPAGGSSSNSSSNANSRRQSKEL